MKLLTERQLEICNAYRQLFAAGRSGEIEDWCIERGIGGREFSETMEAMREQLEAQSVMTDRQMEIVRALMDSKSGADMDTWLSERDISDAEFRAAMMAFDAYAKARGLYYEQ